MTANYSFKNKEIKFVDSICGRIIPLYFVNMLFVSQRELMDINIGKEPTVSLDERVKEAYNAVFVREYSGRCYKVNIGRDMFCETTKTSLLRRVSLLFETANYD